MEFKFEQSKHIKFYFYFREDVSIPNSVNENIDNNVGSDVDIKNENIEMELSNLIPNSDSSEGDNTEEESETLTTLESFLIVLQKVSSWIVYLTKYFYCKF